MDETLLHKIVHNENDAYILHKDLNLLTTWTSEWQNGPYPQ